VPGVGPVVSRTLLANLPELGHLNRHRSRRWSASRRSPVIVALSRASGWCGAAARLYGPCSIWAPWSPRDAMPSSELSIAA
jgi:hypothetical protein